MASFDTLERLTAHPEWIVPRSDLRVFLGEPGAPEATKTTVEPGNAFSPGMLTFGITWWLRFPDSDTFFAPEEAPLDALRWRYQDGYLPVIHCDTGVGDVTVHHSLFQDGTAALRSEAVHARLELCNAGATAVRVQVFVALRSLGPAGGPVYDLAVGHDGRSVWLAARHLPLLVADRSPAAIGCGVGDPSPLARTGLVPSDQSVADTGGWCFGLLRFDLTLAPKNVWRTHLEAPQQSYGNLHRELPGTAMPAPERFDERSRPLLASWRERFGRIALTVPDRTFHDAFFAGLGHMLTALVGDQARIAPLSYPLPWLRDSIYIIRCFDAAGLHDSARAAANYCARNDFFGGFGAEGDAPGQGIWLLVQHYRITRDRTWLESVYPAIRRKCDWLFRMRRTPAPIHQMIDTPMLAFTHAERNAGCICLAAKDGLIQGTMDHGVSYALGWVNHWALCGLREAAHAARVLGRDEHAATYEAEAATLWAALQRYADETPSFFEHERTVSSLLWPTAAWADAPDRAEAGFDRWWAGRHGTDGSFAPEPYWLYFEFAQAHNALLFGQRERAWQVIDHRLRCQDLPGLYGWREGGAGVGTENATRGVSLVPYLRGCQRYDSITPHGWSQAEMWLLQRAVLVDEWRNGLVLFAGVRADWLQPGAHIAFRDFPTAFGTVSAELRVDGAATSVTARGIEAGTPVAIWLPNGRSTAISDGGTLHLEMERATAP